MLTALLSTANASAVRVVDPLNSEIRTWYDHGGLPRFVRDARNFVTENRYDVLGRLVETIAPTQNGAVASTKFQYDAAGNQTRVEDGKGNVTTFTYDHGNRVLVQAFANGDTITNTYDARNLRTRTDAAGTTVYTYDAENRLKTADPAGPALRTCSYDAVGRLIGVTEADNPTAAVAYTHDALDRVLSETSRGLTNTHTYDLAGRPLTTAYSSGASVIRTYNDLGLIETLTDDAGRTTTWKYDKAGRARALVLPNGRIQERCRGTEAFWTEAKPEPEGRAARAGAASQNTHDAAGRLSSRALKTAAGVILAAFGWAHDAAGNVTAQSEVWPGSAERAAGTHVTAMTYHDGGWLESESVTEPGQAPRLTLYGYDNAANRTGKTVSVNGVVSTATTYTFNPANQLVGWTERNGEGATLRSATLTFDTRGNRSGQTITQPGAPAKTTSYSWDYQNRLVGVTDPQGGQHAYAYDYRTRRIGRSEPGGATAVSWSGGLSLAEYPVSGLQGNVSNATSPTVEYRRGPDMGGGIGGLLHSLRDGAPKYNLGNGRGDVVAQSDATGALTWTASYEAFGKRPVETGTNADRQRANTKEEDPTGLLWEHFRYRDLETGVWLSRDPAGFVDGPNLYAYVRQNPWSKFDPLGLWLMEKTPSWYQKAASMPGGSFIVPGAAAIEVVDAVADPGIEAKGAYTAARNSGDSVASSVGYGAAVGATRATGMLDIGEAVSGEAITFSGDGDVTFTELSDGERVNKAIEGGAKMVGTAVGGARGGTGLAGRAKGGKSASPTQSAKDIGESNLHTRGVNPAPGSRTLDGYVSEEAAAAEIGLYTKSTGFDATAGSTQFKRFGSGEHAKLSPHVHQPIRNLTPNGPRGTTGTKRKNGGVTKPTKRDVKQLYQRQENGKYKE